MFTVPLFIFQNSDSIDHEVVGRYTLLSLVICQSATGVIALAALIVDIVKYFKNKKKTKVQKIEPEESKDEINQEENKQTAIEESKSNSFTVTKNARRYDDVSITKIELDIMRGLPDQTNQRFNNEEYKF